MIPSYAGEKWDYSIERFSEPSEMCFPDENYSYEEMAESCVFIGAYEEECCIGLGFCGMPSLSICICMI